MITFPNKKNFQFHSSNNVFLPNLTSKLIFDTSLKKIILSKRKTLNVLEMGCGIGAIGISLILSSKKKINYHASDLSKSAINITRKNISRHNLKDTETKIGSMFEPWNKSKKRKFDLIINDVSAISNKVAKISPWFTNNIPSSETDHGLENTMDFLLNYKNFLNKKGIAIFPFISLSSKKFLTKFLKKNDIQPLVDKKVEWPLPKNLLKHKKILEKLKKNNIISYTYKHGFIICETEVLVIKN